MHDPMTVAQALVDHALAQHADQVDVVCFYGSRARGDARPDSDLDIYYVPVDGYHPPVGKTFLLDGLLYDFWGIHWSLLEGFATGRVRGFAFAPALVAGSQVLHARNDAARERLAGLQRETERLCSPAARPEMVRRACEHYGQVSAKLALMQLASETGSLSDVRYAGWQLLEAIWECLALANQVYFERGMAKSLREVARFGQRPDSLQHGIEVIGLAREVAPMLAAALTLVRETREVLKALQATLPAQENLAQVFGGAYPELKDALGKVLAACAQGDRLAASAHAFKVQYELTQMLDATSPGQRAGAMNLLREMSVAYRAAGLPDLIGAASQGNASLAQAVTDLDAALRALLQAQSVALEEMPSLTALW